MLSIKDILKVLQSYNINSTNLGPSIYHKGNEIGISLDIKDSNFGFLTRYFTFKKTSELDDLLKKLLWYQKNHQKWHITQTLNDYEIPNPKIIYKYEDKELTYEEMINLEQNIIKEEKENFEDTEKESLLLNIEGLTNYLINLKNNKINIRQEKNNLKIAENELKYTLLEALNTYYGNTKPITKRPVSLDIITNNINNDELQNNLKQIKEKSLIEINDYLTNLIKTIKEEELDEKYIINIYSNSVYKYNINILNKQIDFVKNKIEAEKNFNLKGSKIHNIDAELKSFLNTNNAPINIKEFLNENLNKINAKYNKINDHKNSYKIISGNLIRMPKQKNVIKNKKDTLENLNKDFDNLTAEKKAHLILYNSFYKEISEKIINEPNIDELRNNQHIEKSYKELEEIAHLDYNNHYLANYFKYINFKNLDTYLNSVIKIIDTVRETTFKLTNTLNVFCIERKDNKELLSINPIYNKKEKVYITTLPENTNILYIPDKINIDEETKELNTISTKNIYIKFQIIDTSDSIIVSKYKKNNIIDQEHNITITTDLILKNKYIFNVGLIEGE